MHLKIMFMKIARLSTKYLSGHKLKSHSAKYILDFLDIWVCIATYDKGDRIFQRSNASEMYSNAERVILVMRCSCYHLEDRLASKVEKLSLIHI